MTDVAMPLRFRPYCVGDRLACITLFDENCPEFFSPNERDDYLTFLDGDVRHYEVCIVEQRIVGAFGVHPMLEGQAGLHWIVLASTAQGRGFGSTIMSRVFERMYRFACTTLHISASHKSAPFFARFGALEHARTMDGWGPGMHRIDMMLTKALTSG